MLNGKRMSAEGETLGLDADTQAEYERVMAELNRLTSIVPLDAPWTMPQAEVFDKMTPEDWFNSKTQNRTLRSLFQVTTRTDFTANSFQMSFLYFLFYLRSADNYDTINGFESGAQAFVVKETLHEVAARLAEQLGKSIVLKAPVQTITQDESGVTVNSEKGNWRGEYAIVAVPMPLSVRIEIRPALSAQRDLLALHMPMGSDGSPPEGKPGLLVGFIDADNAVKWTGTPMEERKRAIVNQLVSFLGPEAAHPIDYEDQDWPADPSSRGCFSVIMGPK
jgi:monoamine oxidase